MRNPVVWGIIYFAVGVAFTYMAIQNPGDMWSFYSILLMVFAAYNINIALKMFAFSVKLKNSSKINEKPFSTVGKWFLWRMYLHGT